MNKHLNYAKSSTSMPFDSKLTSEDKKLLLGKLVFEFSLSS